jgi:aflatoxin B1 aldehyde reductase
VEDELLPLLKKNNCSFIAYNPLAAGLLTGKHKSKDEVKTGRFKDNPNYLPRFYTEKNFEGLGRVEDALDLEEDDVSMVELTYRWLLRHSALGLNDGILIGASSMEQLFENLSACVVASTEGPLSELAVEGIDEAWLFTREVAFPYWRSYSADMPDRENLDQGASYSPAKKA